MNATVLRRGYTLVEAIVVTALVVVVLGIALDAFIETNRAAHTVSDKLICLREAQTIAQTIEKYLRSSLLEKGRPLEFKMDRLQSPVVKAAMPLNQKKQIESTATSLDVDVVQLTITNDVERRRVVVEEQPPEGAPKKLILGTNSDAYCAEVVFAYAEKIENFEPRWQDEATTIPKLAKIAVRVWPRVSGFNSFDDARKAAQPRHAELEYWVRMQ
ncbi:MAG: hypothetical protein N2Z21_07730 [Candidatus Sumerlaeaceae bacterium]|nr:hypothetical protein [Candidatus Sumerlaeaceae bacterium]